MNTQLDLSELAFDRSTARESTSIKPRPRRWFARYVIPISILMGFVMLLAIAAGRQWMPARSVTVIPVIVKRAELQQTGTPLFQSPGWIEPRPTAIGVAALASGVIEELLVVEGQYLEKGEPVARLISIDAELIVEQAKNSLAIRDGELNRAKAELDAAKLRFENPVHIQVLLADARSTLAKTQTELAKLPFLIKAAEANVKYATGDLEGKQAAEGAIPGRSIERAKNDLVMAQATLQELQKREPNLQLEVDALKIKVDAVQRQLELLVEETRQVAEANARLQSAEALRDEATLQLRQAELVLDRNVIRAPMEGKVLRLLATPGSRVTGPGSSSEQGSGAVIEMYDPNHLQVRADVRLEDVPLVTPGQPVQIETASSAGVIQGRVLQTTSAANIQKNTLEVKVELIDPPPSVNPEMLVTATFLAPVMDNASELESEVERIFVPSQLVQSSNSGAFVWVVDAQHIARQRIVEVGRPHGNGLLEIKTGLNVTDKLIVNGLEGLTVNSRVQVIGDDRNMGLN